VRVQCKLMAVIVAVCAAVTVACVNTSTTMTGLDGLALPREGRTMRSSSSDPNWRDGNADKRPIAPDETLVLADLQGPGIIRHLWNTVSSPERGYSRLLVLRMYWDGEEHPSVECPLGDFFGVGHGMDVPFNSFPVRVTSQGRARNCYWSMPFRRSARITVTNEGRMPVRSFYYYVDWQKLSALDEETAYFHAMYRQEFPAVMGRNYLIADIEGRGNYVGTVQSVRQRTPGWWGEGDDFFFIDGETEPSLRGTGTEDYYCDAWGFREMAGLCYGAPVVEGPGAYDRCSVYRWHIADPVTFTKSLRVEIEHKGFAFNEDGSVRTGFTERPDDFSSVAFWYQTEPHKPYPAMPVGYARLFYDYGTIIEAEGLVPNATATRGDVTLQRGRRWSGRGQLVWEPDAPGETLTVPFNVKDAGTHVVLMLASHSPAGGVFETEIDGNRLGEPMDLFGSSPSVEEHVLGASELDAGEHRLTVRVTGRHPGSTGYSFGLDGVLVTLEQGRN